MTIYKEFYNLLGELADLFDAEQKSGGHEAAIALRNISAKSHTPLPPSHQILRGAIDDALGLNPLPIAKKIKTILPIIDWHYAGLADGRIHPELANEMATAELIGPDGMVYCEHLRVGLFAQAANVDYYARKHAADESYIMIGGSAQWKASDAPVSNHSAGDIIHHPPYVPHSSTTTSEPFIAAWRWTGDIGYEKYTLTG